jgi:1-acyl-sn-glycerol-3-phosphate acyltransferase
MYLTSDRAEILLSNLDKLTEINLNDLDVSFGWEEMPFRSALLRILFKPTARKFARMMLEFDTNVASTGLDQASKELLNKFARTVTVFGKENVPTGPVLVLSNHPGMVDTLALFSALQRLDLRIIAVKRPFLAALTNIRHALQFITDVPGERIGLVKRSSKHLNQGGAVLTFPAGGIDPDPSVYPGAKEALLHWTDSAGVFLRLSPETVVLPVLVSGVIWAKTANSPFIRALKRDQVEREKLAAAFQLIAHIIFGIRPLEVVVQIGEPINISQAQRSNKEQVHQLILAAMRDLISTVPKGKGELIV